MQQATETETTEPTAPPEPPRKTVEQANAAVEACAAEMEPLVQRAEAIMLELTPLKARLDDLSDKLSDAQMDLYHLVRESDGTRELQRRWLGIRDGKTRN